MHLRRWSAALREFGPDARRVLALTSGAALLAAYGGSVLFYALPAVSRDFHARLLALADLGSVLALAPWIALPLAGLADRQGRRRLLPLGLGVASLADLGSAFSGSLGALTASRFVAAAGEELVFALAAVMVVESVPREHRALANVALALAAGAGIGLSTVLYPLVAPHWRLLYVPAAALGIPAAAVLWRALPEPRTWAQAGRRGAPLRALASPPWRDRLLVLGGSALLGAVLFEPVGLLAAFFATRVLGLSPAVVSLVMVVSAPFSVAGFLAGGWLSDRFGRRRLGVLLSTLAAVTDALTFLGGGVGFWFGNVASSLAAGAVAPLLAAWTGELLPTRGRATGEAAAAVAGGVGSGIGLHVFARVAGAQGFGAAALGGLAAALAGAALLLLLPETGGLRLPD